jgi:hypothetical protein
MGMLSSVLAAAVLAAGPAPADLVISEGSPPDATNLQVEFVCGADKLELGVDSSAKGGGAVSRMRWNGRAYPAAVVERIRAALAPMHRVSNASARCNGNDGTISVLVGGLRKLTLPVSGTDDLLVGFTVNAIGLAADPRVE